MKEIFVKISVILEFAKCISWLYRKTGELVKKVTGTYVTTHANIKIHYAQLTIIQVFVVQIPSATSAGASSSSHDDRSLGDENPNQTQDGPPSD